MKFTNEASIFAIKSLADFGIDMGYLRVLYELLFR
jgi:hypothetical protein